MSDSLNNKELVAVGHQFAKAMSTYTPILDIAKIVSRLAERLDCTTAALQVMYDENGKLASENEALKKAEPAPFRKLMMEALDAYHSGADEVPELAMLSAYTKLRDGIKTPATDAFLAEVRAQGADAVADQHRRKYEELKPINVFCANEHMDAQEVAESVAGQLRQGGAA